MSLSAAFNIISSSFAANAAQARSSPTTSPTSTRTGYSREVANLVTNSYGGADVASVTRIANAALTEQVSTSTSQAAAQQAIANGLATLAATVDDSSSTSSTSGADQNGASPSAMLANLQSALDDLCRTRRPPSSAADAAVTAATESRPIAERGRRGSQPGSRAGRPGHGLVGLDDQFPARSVPDRQQRRRQRPRPPAQTSPSAEDTRDSLVTQLAQQIGVTTSTASNGSMSIYTDSGVTLFQDTRAHRLLHRRRRPTSTASTGNAVTVDGVPITGVESPHADPVGRARRLCGAARHARAAVSGAARPDRRRPHQRLRRKRPDRRRRRCPRCPAFSPRRGRRASPRPRTTTGLAAAIEVNPNVDPSQGGDATLLRDGGISPATRPMFTTRPATASYHGRVCRRSSAQIGSTTQSFDTRPAGPRRPSARA